MEPKESSLPQLTAQPVADTYMGLIVDTARTFCKRFPIDISEAVAEGYLASVVECAKFDWQKNADEPLLLFKLRKACWGAMQKQVKFYKVPENITILMESTSDSHLYRSENIEDSSKTDTQLIEEQEFFNDMVRYIPERHRAGYFAYISGEISADDLAKAWSVGNERFFNANMVYKKVSDYTKHLKTRYLKFKGELDASGSLD